MIESSWIIEDKGSLSTKDRLRILCGQALRPMLRDSFPVATEYSKYTLTRIWHGSAQTKKINNKPRGKNKPDLCAPLAFTASRNRSDGDLVGPREIAHSQLSPRVVS